MSDSYKYLDPDYTYIDPKSGILRNLQGISDKDELIFVESSVVTKRLKELYENHMRIERADKSAMKASAERIVYNKKILTIKNESQPL